jgi:hypothetical protein
MHAAVFDADWSSEDLMVKHRALVAADHRGGRGREIIALDWTLSHHERGPHIHGVKQAYDYVEDRYCQFQTVVTATISNRELVDGVAVEVQLPIKVKGRNGEERKYWAFTKVVRLKRYGRKRLVIVHEKEDLSDAPRFLLTDALHWESGRVIETWTYRWPSEIFHEFSKQVTGFESAQVRKEEAVKRHFRLSCVAQSLVQQAACSGGKSERFAFADEKATVGQKVYTIAREALAGVLQFAQGLFAQGRTCDQVLEALMPA